MGAGNKAEILAVGAELLTPDRSDTNSLYITRKLNEAGFEVHLKSIVGDDEAEIADLLRKALGRSKLVVVCGGLGPTEDDRTRAGAARALDRTVAMDPEVLGALERRFAARGYRMTRNNERQAEIIEGAVVLENKVGSAPGMWISHEGASLVLLPGPPEELESMFEFEVMPRVRRIGGNRRLERRVLRIAGIPESQVDARVAPIYTHYPQVATTILAAMGYIELRLQQWVSPGGDAAALQELTSRIRDELGLAIFSANEESLEEVVGKLLRNSGRTLAVAESCTSGMVGMHVTAVPGSSDYFLGGILCYSNEVKIRQCGVPRELLERVGAVSPETAEALARGVRETIGSSIGLSVTGIAGPGGGSIEKPVGLVYVGLSDRSGTTHERRIFSGNRRMVRERTTFFALSLLHRRLIGDIGGQK